MERGEADAATVAVAVAVAVAEHALGRAGDAKRGGREGG